jgi:hypothetical protein
VEGLPEQFVLIMGGLEQLDIGRQSRGMRQKHAERDLAAGVFLSSIVFGESGQKLDQRLVELEQTAIIQDHAGGGGGNHLGDRGEIVDGFRSYGRGSCVVSEMPEAFVGDQLSLMSNGDGCSRESTLVNAGAQDGKGTLKLVVLPAERMGQRAVGTLVQKILSCCFCFRFITHSVHR